jgi:hypothetical protein
MANVPGVRTIPANVRGINSLVTTAAQALAIAVALTSLIAGIVGAVYWWLVRPERLPWLLIRGAQVVAGIQVLGALGLAAAGLRPDDQLYWLYAALPVAIGFFAEQIKLVSAQSVLDARGLADGEAVAKLPADRQQSVITAILRRELGVMVAAEFVVLFLALRALGTV